MSDYESKPPRIGLWANDRGPMASGNCGGIRFVLWDNRGRKQNDRQPDFQLVLEAAQKREDRQQDRQDAAPGDDSDLPF